MVEKPDNCFELFFNRKGYALFLDLAFENYKKKGKDEEEMYKLATKILINLFINCCIYCEKQPNFNPANEIETLLFDTCLIIF